MDDGALGRLVQTYLDHLVVERGVSRHTLAAYRRDLQRYVAFLAGEGVRDPAAVTPALVAEHAMRLRAGVRAAGGDGWAVPPLAPASVARAVVAVRSLHRFAVDEGVSATDPAAEVRPPTPGRRLPKALRVDQVQALLAAPPLDTPAGLRDAALLEVLYGTGTRISEAVGLDVDEVTRALDDPHAGLRVLGKGRKERLVPLGSYARAAVTAYLVRGRPVLAARGTGSAALFLGARGARLSRQSGWAVLQRAAEQAGLGTEVSPHTLRHSFATHLLDGGADVRVVQELLGHASVTTTQIYTLVTVDHLREVYLTSHPRAHG
ncbi:site-specific tyrosine recombinase XerD [Friedmanniella luteola]|uniref:site-specific tyrosine recombinase XerD n=1 Tax=Friedmanniella luteola TaxID=546871 RepID=UPI0018D37414|nr:site-specific tyrosine recombinase XerD [Friedmanniella luteola]